ncbi:MAG: FAD:protein FMN transferase, partial [Pirellulales bacterium]
ETGGAFDVTVGSLVNLWNFGPEQYDERVPSDELLQQTARRVGDGLFEARLDPPALKKLHPGVYVDLSAIAKGYGVDVVADFLKNQEVAHYMVEIGGEVRTRDLRGDGQPWRMGIETPTDSGRGIQTVLHLSDAALATSGDYRNFFEIDGRRFSHVVDPRTGRPIEHGLASVSVIAEHCIDADAYATALMVLGPEAGYNWALSRDMAVLMIIRDGENFIEKSTPGFDLFRKSTIQPEDSP